MLLIAARVGALQQQDIGVEQHLEVLAPIVVHGLHRGRIHGVLGARLRGEVPEELHLTQGGRHSDSTGGDLAGLVRVDAAAVLDVVDPGLDE